MKILFVDNSADLQQKYIEPLRKKGWGVVRARSVEDADRMMILHGEGLDAIVVSEKFVSFAERNEPSFVVLTNQWSEKEIAQHQASKNPALAYVAFSDGIEKLYSTFKYQSGSEVVQSTGTDGVPVVALSLENVTGVLARPEPTRTYTKSLSLTAPLILLGGVDTRAKPEVEVMDEQPSIELTTPESVPESSTVILEATQVAEALGLSDVGVPLEDVSHDFSLETESPYESGDLTPFSTDLSLEQAPPLSRPVVTGSGGDIETLKSYLALREQDVALLSGQYRSSQERARQLEMQVKLEKARSSELQQMLMRHEQKIKSYDQEKQVELEVMEKQLDDLNQQLKDRTEKVRTFEAKLRITSEEVSKVKDRVRVDIRRIRVREKELESQLEVLKKDSSALLQARDEKILELKRKVDLLEFNMELVQEQFQRERQSSDDLKMRLKDAAQVMKQANGLLEQ